ncbi:MAG: methanethiol S-methyltransferase [Phycisphaerales bacterium]
MSSPESTISFCAPASAARHRSATSVAPAEPVSPADSLADRIGIFLFGVASYTIFFVTFLYAFGWVAGVGMPTALDAPRVEHEALPWFQSLAINVGLLLLFAVQHSVMARPWFKAWLTRSIPEPAERSLYVLLSSAALLLMFWLWQPLGGVVWSVDDPVWRGLLWGLMGFGWLLVFVSTWLINHFDLFGLRQVWLHLRGKPYTHLKFRTPGPYKHVRHPLYVGWLFGFWATPTMTVAHLLFAVVTTVYILMAIRWEERDLEEFHGEAYRRYRREVPMLVPRLRGSERPEWNGN